MQRPLLSSPASSHAGCRDYKRMRVEHVLGEVAERTSSHHCARTYSHGLQAPVNQPSCMRRATPFQDLTGRPGLTGRGAIRDRVIVCDVILTDPDPWSEDRSMVRVARTSRYISACQKTTELLLFCNGHSPHRFPLALHRLLKKYFA